MRIAVNTRFVIKDKLEGIGWFSWESASRMAAQHPEHEFIFLFDRAYDPEFVALANVEGRVLFPPARRPFLWKIWFDYAIPRALKRIGADLFVSLDGFCSLKTSLPTYMVVHDLAFEHFPDHVPKDVKQFYTRYSPQYANHAKRIGTVSEATKKDIISKYKIAPEKIDVLYNGAGNLFRVLNDEEKLQARKSFTAGSRYFVYVGSLNPRKNLERLFQAFDAYSKSSPNGFKLLVVGRMAWKSGPIQKALEKMEFADSVVLTGHLAPEKLALAIGGAEAMVYPSLFEGFGIPILEAFTADVPVITSNISSMPEVAGDAAILVDPYSVDAIKDAMLQLENTPNLRTKLIAKGQVQSQKFSWDQTASRLWEGINKMI
ncbi:MAG: glycosyltransferase involved in cell wall biosynthesis [Limisphaerales bacterium]|jgi:glycosyltransferase involved in cell wall biosynthesis